MSADDQPKFRRRLPGLMVFIELLILMLLAITVVDYFASYPYGKFDKKASLIEQSD